MRGIAARRQGRILGFMGILEPKELPVWSFRSIIWVLRLPCLVDSWSMSAGPVDQDQTAGRTIARMRRESAAEPEFHTY